MASFVCLAAARNAVLRRNGWDVEADGLAGRPRVRVFVGEAGPRDDTLGPALSRLRRKRDAHPRRHRRPHGRRGAARRTGRGHGARHRHCPGRADQHRCVRPGAAPSPRSAGTMVPGCTSMAPSACGRGPSRSWPISPRGWRRPIPGPSTATSGCKSPTTAASPWCATPRPIAAPCRSRASYLPVAGESEYDPGQLTPELSRRARGFAVWAVLRSYGRRGVAEMVRRHCTLARHLARKLAAEPGIRVLNTVELNQVIVGFGEGPPHSWTRWPRGDCTTGTPTTTASLAERFGRAAGCCGSR